MKLRRGIISQVCGFLDAHNVPYNNIALRMIARSLYGSGESGYLRSKGRLFEAKFLNVDGALVATITRDYYLGEGEGVQVHARFAA